MKLVLDRAIVFLDIEATGVIPTVDRIVDLALVKMQPDGPAERHYWRLDPERPIPAEASAVHGIRDEDVRGNPTFGAVAGQVAALLHGCDLAGFGITKFDVPMLVAEFSRAGVAWSPNGRRLVDALVIFHQRERRDLKAAVRFYLNRDFPGAHGAVQDAEAAMHVLEAQLARYADMPKDVANLDRLCNRRDPNWIDQTGKLAWSGDEVVINFGKNRGRMLRELAREDPGYLDWMLAKEFPEDVVQIIREARAGRFPAKTPASVEDLPF